MLAQKNIFTLTFLVVTLLAVNFISANEDIDNYADKSNHLFVGTRVPGDRLVLKEHVVKNSSWMKVVTLEKTFNTSAWERITMVQALDQKTNGNGAHPSLLQGGPGSNSVTLRFKSKRGHSINFIVEIYAR